MPRELRDKEEFQKMLPAATEVRVLKNGDAAKIKLRTRYLLYTYKTTSEEADIVTKGLKIPVLEF